MKGKKTKINDGGGSGILTENDVEKYDIVVTTYNILEAEEQVFEAWRSSTTVLQRTYDTLRGDAEEAAQGFMMENRRWHYDLIPEFTSAGIERNYWPMGQVRWNIIILDEAHCLRTLNNTTSGLIDSMQARFKVAMTGTFLNNRIEDVGAICETLEGACACWQR